MFKFATAVLAMLAMTSIAHAEIRTQEVDYQDGTALCKGFLAYDDATEELKPAVLVFPEWWGVTDFTKSRATELAKLGYVAFVADVYGNGESTEAADQAGEWAGPFKKDRKLTRTRCMAALDTLKSQKRVDKDRVVAIGYCFGGMCALELARAGAPLVGVITFHGDLSRTADEGTDQIKSKILVCHGGDDTFVGPKVLADFEQEMKDVGADYQINIYSKAKHAFTNPAADGHHIDGIAYNAEADHRSWAAAKSFFDEVFKPM